MVVHALKEIYGPEEHKTEGVISSKGVGKTTLVSAFKLNSDG